MSICIQVIFPNMIANQSYTGNDKCPIFVSYKEIEFMKSYSYKDEKNANKKTKGKRLE